MSLGFILILEAIVAVLTGILLFHLVGSVEELVIVARQRHKTRLGSIDHNTLWDHQPAQPVKETHLNSSSVSNFLGFLGQQSHMK